MSSSHLNGATRAAALERLAGGEPLDVVVIGGGVTGAGVALDAASRGLSVALVERSDLAHGTSRWSSKLVHGGLRYLAHGDVAVAYESARERAIAPALRPDGLRRAIVGWDAQLEDDARLVIAIARTAAAHGALVVTRCGVRAVEPGRVHARDELTGEPLEIAARHVVNATGV